jgi:uncharacterized protein YjiS (DUF1127 family)
VSQVSCESKQDRSADLRAAITIACHATTASASRVAGFLRTHWNAFRARRERARARAMLYGMDDRGLKDIGLRRCEIDSALMDAAGERIRTHLKI